jgi:DNA-binding response OmpR family regulator
VAQPGRRLGHSVRVDSKDVYLTPAEFRLWESLHSHPDRTFTWAELVARVMPDTIVLERTIDVHIQSLRRKLGPAASLIATVRGEGHRFVSG